jgi:hypothetical protein
VNSRASVEAHTEAIGSATNRVIAGRLEETAALLEYQGASPFRINAYRRAANTIEALHADLQELVEQRGYHGLEELPGIGTGIGSAIREMLATGRWTQLERLRGAVDPVALFMTIPGVGPDLARRMHDGLGVDTLEALETAAYDGRLDALPGIGSRRVQSVRAGLAAALGRSQMRQPRASHARPAVAELLKIDAQYRTQARAGELKRIAPKRFNPAGEAWLPIMHAEHAGWHFTALYSNTARAHELDRTRDWVVIYYYDHDHVEGQCTVVTETSGHLKGYRVVRGHESECSAHYDAGGTPRGSA